MILRAFQAISRAVGYLLLLSVALPFATANAQNCSYYLNASDGSDANLGTAPSEPWRSFEYAFDQATDGSTICTAAGEYFQGPDKDDGGITLDRPISVTFVVEPFGDTQTLRFSAGTFVVRQGTIRIEALNAETLVFGAGLINQAQNNFAAPYDLTGLSLEGGTLDVSGISTTFEATVSDFVRSTDAIWLGSPTFEEMPGRTIQITGNQDATAGPELKLFPGATVRITHEAGTYTIDEALTLPATTRFEQSGAGHLDFLQPVTATIGEAALVTHSGTGRIHFQSTLLLEVAEDNPAHALQNVGQGQLEVASASFIYIASPGGGQVTSGMVNNGTGTLTIRQLTQTDGTGSIEVAIENMGDGTTLLGSMVGAPVVISGLLKNGSPEGTITISGTTELYGGFSNTGLLQLDAPLQLLGPPSSVYTNDGEIRGEAFVEILAASTVMGGSLTNIDIQAGPTTLNVDQITDSLTATLQEALDVSVVTASGVWDLVSNTQITVTGDAFGSVSLNSPSNRLDAPMGTLTGSLTIAGDSSWVNIGVVEGDLLTQPGSVVELTLDQLSGSLTASGFLLAVANTIEGPIDLLGTSASLSVGTLAAPLSAALSDSLTLSIVQADATIEASANTSIVLTGSTLQAVTLDSPAIILDLGSGRMDGSLTLLGDSSWVTMETLDGDLIATDGGYLNLQLNNVTGLLSSDGDLDLIATTTGPLALSGGRAVLTVDQITGTLDAQMGDSLIIAVSDVSAPLIAYSDVAISLTASTLLDVSLESPSNTLISPLADITGAFSLIGGDNIVVVQRVTGPITISGISDLAVADQIIGDVTIAGNTTLDTSILEGALIVTDGTTVALVDYISGTVETQGAGGLRFEAASGTEVGGLLMGGSGSIVAGTSLLVSGDLTLVQNSGGTLEIETPVSVQGAYVQGTGATLDLKTQTLTLLGRFTRTGGTFRGTTGTLRFEGGVVQNIQIGSDIVLAALEIAGLQTRATLQAGDFEITDLLRIESGAVLDLNDQEIRLVGQASALVNDGTFEGENGQVAFLGPVENMQTLSGGGLFGNMRIELARSTEYVSVTNPPGQTITCSCLLDFMAGGILLSGQDFDLSDTLRGPEIKRNTSAGGGFETALSDQFNPSGTAYNLTYYGAGKVTSGSLISAQVVNLSLLDAVTVTLNDSYTIQGLLSIDPDAMLMLANETLTLIDVGGIHSIGGLISGSTPLLVAGANTLDGGLTGSIDRLRIDTNGTVSLSDFLQIDSLEVIAGDVSLSMSSTTYVLPDGTPATAGMLGGLLVEGGSLTLMAPAWSTSETIRIEGGVFDLGGQRLYLDSESTLNTDAPAVLRADSLGQILVVGTGVSVGSDINGNGEHAPIPNLSIMQPSGGILSLTGDLALAGAFDHVSGEIVADEDTLRIEGHTWTYGLSAGPLTGVAEVHLRSDSLHILASKTIITNDLRIESDFLSVATTGQGPGMEANGLVIWVGGTMDLQAELVLAASGLAFRYEDGALLPGAGLRFAGATAQSFEALRDLELPTLHLDQDVTMLQTVEDDVTPVLRISDSLWWGQGSLAFAADGAGSQGHLALLPGTQLLRDGLGTISAANTLSPAIIFPDDGYVDVHYIEGFPEGGATDVELPENPLALGTLTISSGARVALVSDITINQSLQLLDGDLAPQSGAQITMGSGAQVERWATGSINGAGQAGANLTGDAWSVRYHSQGSTIRTLNGELPDGIPLQLSVAGGGTVTLHAPRVLQSVEVDSTTFDLEGHALVLLGSLHVNSGLLRSDSSPITIGDTLYVGPSGESTGARMTVTGPSILDGALTASTLLAKKAVSFGSGVYEGLSLTLSGTSQSLTLAQDLSLQQLTLQLEAASETPVIPMVSPTSGVILRVDSLSLQHGILLLDSGARVELAAADPNAGYPGFERTLDTEGPSHIAGRVSLPIQKDDTGLWAFPVGTETAYRPALLTFTNAAPALTSATLSVTHLDFPPLGTTALPLGEIRAPAPFSWRLMAEPSMSSAQVFDLEVQATGLNSGQPVSDLRLIERLDGDLDNPWILSEGDYANFDAGSPEAPAPIIRVTGIQGGLVPQGWLYTVGLTDPGAAAWLQLIHTATPADDAVLDVYLNEERIQDDFIYEEASPILLITLPDGELSAAYTLSVAPSNSTVASDAILTIPLTLEQNALTVAIVHDDADSLGVVTSDQLPLSSSDPTAVDFRFFHLIADAPPFSLRRFDGVSGAGPVLVPESGFAAMDPAPLLIDPASYTLEAASSTTDQLFASQIDLTPYAGQVIFGVASGLLSPPVGRESSRGAKLLVIDSKGAIQEGLVVTEVAPTKTLPQSWSVSSPYPNPSSQDIAFLLDLPAPGTVIVEVFDLLGRLVHTHPPSPLPAGSSQPFRFTPGPLAAGTYLFRITLHTGEAQHQQTGLLVRTR